MNDQSKPTGEVMVTGCEITGGSSRVCEHGQKSCEIRHTKPTGEWTAQYLTDRWFAGLKLAKEIADAHNATLADAKQEGIDWADKQYYGISGHQRILDLEAQLEADREKHRKEMEAVTMNTSDIETVQQVHDKLSAEQERYKQLEIHADFADEQLRQLREEMASIQQLANIGNQL